MSRKKKPYKPDHIVVIDLEMCRIYKKAYARYRRRQVRVNSEIIQLGAVLADGQGNIRDRFERNMRPEYGKLDTYVTNLTGIKKQDLVNAPSFADVLAEFAEWIPDGKLLAVAWGPDDLKQLDMECRLKRIRTEGKLMSLLARRLNLQAVYDRKVGLHNQLSLEDALRISGIEPEGEFHDALDDAINTAQLYKMVIGGQDLVADEQLFNEKKQKEEEQRREAEERKQAKEEKRGLFHENTF